ncbi:LOW QUALITY PROTEIN: putative transmembrane protein 244 [Sarcophilus harrisii]
MNKLDILAPFDFKTNPSFKTNYKGCGLILMICRGQTYCLFKDNFIHSVLDVFNRTARILASAYRSSTFYCT